MIRLICPNCDTNYQVPDETIPDAGRDVQCSNCGLTWFFDPVVASALEPETLAVLAEPKEVQAERTRQAFSKLQLSQGTEKEAASSSGNAPQNPKPKAQSPGVLDAEILSGSLASSAPPQKPGNPQKAELQRKSEPPVGDALPPNKPYLSDTAAEVLRQEAAREKAQRIAAGAAERSKEAPSLPTEPHTKEASSAIATPPQEHKKPPAPSVDAVTYGDPSSAAQSQERDAYESHQAASEQEITAQEENDGFYRGFGLSVLIAACATLLYLQAGNIAEGAPVLEPSLEIYTQNVDAARSWLERRVSEIPW